MSNAYDIDEPLLLPPPKRTLSEYQHVDWRRVRERLDNEYRDTVLGWVRIQNKVTRKARLRPSEIAKRMNVSSDLLDVRFEPAMAGSESWNENRVNEIYSDSVRRKISQRKNALGTLWGWDTWVRWSPPTEGFFPHQLERIERVEKRRAKNAEANADVTKALVKPLEERAAKIKAMSPFDREVFYLQEEIDALPKDIRGWKENQLRLMKARREVSLRKNHRWGQVGWREWRIQMTRRKAGL